MLRPSSDARTAAPSLALLKALEALLVCFAACACSKPDSAPGRPQPTAVAAQPSAHRASAASPRASTASHTANAVPNAAEPAFPLLPAECREPRVAAASAPLSALARSGWNWPWVTQTLLAYEMRFVFEPSEIGGGRRVTLHQREVKQPRAPARAELVAACQTSSTCNELAKVLRDSIPGNRATPYCATQPEPGNGLSLVWSALLPPLPESAVAGHGDTSAVVGPHDVERACVRWAVCSHQQESSRPVELGLECLKKPNEFERQRRCASGPTCFDVARCAGQGTRAGPEPALWRDFEAQGDHQQAFWLAGRQLYSPGGDPLVPSMLYGQMALDLEAWSHQKSPGRWFVVAIGYDASDPADLGPGTRAMQSVSASWQLQYRTLETTIFGPVQTASGQGDNVSGVPAFQTVIGRGPELLFDYDGDTLPEVGVYQLSWHHTLPPQVTLGVWTVKQGRIVPYPPADKLSAVGVMDIDGDDRPDLLLDSRDEFLGPDGCSYASEPSCIAESHSSLDPDGAAHALPNGTFSTKDAVAARAARERPWN